MTARTANSIDSVMANQSNVIVPRSSLDRASFENLSHNPETVVGDEPNRDSNVAPTVNRARSGPIPLVGSSIVEITPGVAHRRLFEYVTRIEEICCNGVDRVCAFRGHVEVLPA